MLKTFIKRLFLSCLCLITVSAGNALATEELNHIVAVVNDDVVLASELEARLNLVREQLRAQNTNLPEEKVLRQQVLERVIVDKLQLQLAAGNNIQVDDETLTTNLRNIAQQNNMSLEQFRATLEREGHDFNAFREEIRNQIAIARLHQQMVGNRINVSEQEVDTLLANEKTWGTEKEYHLGHILIAVPDGASPEQNRAAQRQAEDTVAALRGGADFASTAVSVSASQTALQGGDLGWRKAGQLPTVMADIINSMQPGDIADPVRAAGGFHIVKLIELRGEGSRQVVTQTHARHILLTADELLPASEVPGRLEQLRERLIGGEDFAALARAHSKDKVSASKGGDLGWVNPGDLVPQFEEAMNALKINEISQPVETRFGWHIIQVLERREHDSTLELKRNQARELIRKRKTDEELELWLRRLRDEAYVEYRTEQ